MISFIIPAHNEEELIGRTIAAIHDAARALGEPYEVVVANDSSTDRTGEIAAKHGARVVNVSHRQIAPTRNAGARAATGELLIFVDADTLVTRPVVRAAVRAARRGVVGGGCSARLDRPPLYGRALMLVVGPLMRAMNWAAGCFLFCTREAFVAVGGFNEELFVGEEVDLSLKLHQRGRFIILREFVITSARKLHTRSALDMLRIGVRLALGGPAALRRREGLDYWYGPRG